MGILMTTANLICEAPTVSSRISKDARSVGGKSTWLKNKSTGATVTGMPHSRNNQERADLLASRNQRPGVEGMEVLDEEQRREHLFRLTNVEPPREEGFNSKPAEVYRGSGIGLVPVEHHTTRGDQDCVTNVDFKSGRPLKQPNIMLTRSDVTRIDRFWLQRAQDELSVFPNPIILSLYPEYRVYWGEEMKTLLTDRFQWNGNAIMDLDGAYTVGGTLNMLFTPTFDCNIDTDRLILLQASCRCRVPRGFYTKKEVGELETGELGLYEVCARSLRDYRDLLSAYAEQMERNDKFIYIYYHATVPEVGEEWEYAGGEARWPAGYYKVDTPTGAIIENGDPVKWHAPDGRAYDRDVMGEKRSRHL